jgi:hypothetical protein
MSDEQTERMREIQNVMAQYSVVANYIKDLETAHSTERFYCEQLQADLAASRAQSAQLAAALEVLLVACKSEQRVGTVHVTSTVAPVETAIGQARTVLTAWQQANK